LTNLDIFAYILSVGNLINFNVDNLGRWGMLA